MPEKPGVYKKPSEVSEAGKVLSMPSLGILDLFLIFFFFEEKAILKHKVLNVLFYISPSAYYQLITFKTLLSLGASVALPPIAPACL